MNTAPFSALLRDAIYQVLDNWVFRILAVLAAVFVLSTFVFGFRQDGIVLLFGLEHWSYDSFLDAFLQGGAPNAPSDAQGIVIDGLLDIVFGQVAGNLGVLFCIAATAFFVPAMLQKGAADVLFHKPLPRLTFYLARYVAGLLFVGVLASLMAAGVYLGLLLVSGYNDPGILLAAPLLTYLFALIYAVSMWVGVMTRSTVASILVTVLFFTVNGCVHQAWRALDRNDLRQLEQLEEGRELARKQEAAEGETTEPGAEADEPEEADSSAAGEPKGTFLTWVENTIRTLHYVLPKTSDADVLASKLRRAVNRPAFRDGDSLVSLFRVPDGFSRDSKAEPPRTTPEVLASIGPPILSLRGSLEESAVRYVLCSRPARTRTVERRGSSREVTESNSQAARALQELLEAAGTQDVSRQIVSFGGHLHANPIGAALLRWGEGGQGRQAVLFKGADGKQQYTLWIEDEAAPSEEREALLFDTIHEVMGYDLRANSFEARFTFTAPWRYNILFSVGSSLAFVTVLLLLGWWKLRRIEF